MARKNCGRDDPQDSAHGCGGVDHGSSAQRGRMPRGRPRAMPNTTAAPPRRRLLGSRSKTTRVVARRSGTSSRSPAAGCVARRRNTGRWDVCPAPFLRRISWYSSLYFLGIAVGVEVDAEASRRIAGYADQEEDQRHDHQYDKDRLQQAANDKSSHVDGEE